VQTPPTSASPPETGAKPVRSRLWLWLGLGLAGALLLLLALGAVVAIVISSSSTAAEPTTLSPAGAVVFTEVVAPPADSHTVPILWDGDSSGSQVVEATVVATARTPGGDLDLVVFDAGDGDGTRYSCLGTVLDLETGWVCDVEPLTDIQVFWGEAASSTAVPFGDDLARSVTIFNAPPDAVAGYVVLDNGSYVGADVVRGVSYVSWDGRLGDFGRLALVDSSGATIYQQDLGS
jgi:hypothetical protein